MTSGLRATGRLAEDVPLGPLTTYKFGGPAKYLITVEGEADLVEAYSIADEEELPVVALGRGSNVVVADDGFEGIVLVAGPALMEREIGVEVVAGSGVPLPVLARESARAGRGGLEFYTGVPGSVGGAVRMNAGCHGQEIFDCLVSVDVLRDGQQQKLYRDEIEFGYRNVSTFAKHRSVILAAELSLHRGRTEELRERRKHFMEIRRNTQPLNLPSSGSVFKNPTGDHAARLIEAAGLKGHRIGQAQISDKHANFIVNCGTAKAADVLALIELARERVQHEFDIELETEVEMIGFKQ